MKIKRFVAPDMRRAIGQVRAELGPDAVIVSTRSVDGGVEIVSAIDYDEVLLARAAGREAATATSPAPAATAVPAATTAGTEAVASMAAAVPPAAVAPEPAPPGVEALQLELEAMRSMLREQFARFSWADRAMLRPELALLQQQIAGLGLEGDLADALLQEAAEGSDGVSAWQRVVRGLARRIAVVEDDPVEEGGVIALVGPTGVGKTTTIAKLAARHCLRHGPDSLLLVSTDDYRVGAQRQLEAFGAILGVPVRRADSTAALARLLSPSRGVRPLLTLIDTAGLAPRDARLTDAMQRLKDVPSVRTFLVLPANVQAAVLRHAIRRFGVFGLAGAVLTKLDEAQGLGAALSVLISEGLPVAWLSEGQRVPEDLKLARPLHLVSWAAVPPSIHKPKTRPATAEHVGPAEACHVAA